MLEFLQARLSAGLTHSTLKDYVAAIRPTTPLLVDSQWADTPWLHVSSAVHWDQQKLNCMRPVRALDTYVHRAALRRRADQFLICYGPCKRGLPASKQTLSRWIVDAINIGYESSDLPSPMGVKAHSTRSVRPLRPFSQVSRYRTSATLRDGLRPWLLSGFMSWTCGPLQALPSSRPRYAPQGYTLGRDLKVWRRGRLVPLAFWDAARVPEEEHL